MQASTTTSSNRTGRLNNWSVPIPQWLWCCLGTVCSMRGAKLEHQMPCTSKWMVNFHCVVTYEPMQSVCQQRKLQFL